MIDSFTARVLDFMDKIDEATPPSSRDPTLHDLLRFLSNRWALRSQPVVRATTLLRDLSAVNVRDFFGSSPTLKFADGGSSGAQSSTPSPALAASAMRARVQAAVPHVPVKPLEAAHQTHRDVVPQQRLHFEFSDRFLRAATMTLLCVAATIVVSALS